MTARAVIFDIGGVLEITPPTGFTAAWENRLGLPAGDLDRRCADIWAAGALGGITEAGIAEPDPEAFTRTCELLGSDPEDCLFIDDHPGNIAAAQAFGMRAILCTGNDRTIAAVEDHLRV